MTKPKKVRTGGPLNASDSHVEDSSWDEDDDDKASGSRDAHHTHQSSTGVAFLVAALTEAFSSDARSPPVPCGHYCDQRESGRRSGNVQRSSYIVLFAHLASGPAQGRARQARGVSTSQAVSRSADTWACSTHSRHSIVQRSGFLQFSSCPLDLSLPSVYMYVANLSLTTA